MDDIEVPAQNVDAAVENTTPVDASPTVEVTTPEKEDPAEVMRAYHARHPEVTDEADLDSVVAVLCPDVAVEDRKKYFSK